MTWLWAIIVGLVLGLIARAILPGEQRIPLWLMVVFGILGGMFGNGVAGWFGVADTRAIDWTRHVLQLIGAIVVVTLGDILWSALQARGSRRGRGRPMV